jgi:surfeit locus 1 family protein
MIRKWPLVPTILVAAAVAAMIGLGLWQLERRQREGSADRPLPRQSAADGRVPATAPGAERGDVPRLHSGMCLLS